MLPVGLTPPARRAESWIAPPIVTVSPADVLIVGWTLLTLSVSPVSLHTPAMAKLLASPLYDAIQRYTPATAGVNEAGPYVALPLTANGAEVKTAAPAHVASSGP